jgi:hypothetical protein
MVGVYEGASRSSATGDPEQHGNKHRIGTENVADRHVEHHG